MRTITCIVFSASLYLAGYSVSWVLGFPAAIWALCALYEILKPIFVLLTIAYFYGVSLWWIMGTLTGCVALWMLFLCNTLRPHQDMGERPYHGCEYTYVAPSHRHRIINERTRLPPSYISRPSAETPQKIVPSKSSYISRSPVDTTSRVLPMQPSISVGVLVDSRLPRCTMPIYPSPSVVDIPYGNPTSGSLMTMADRQPVCIAGSSTQPARKIPASTPRTQVDGNFLHASVTAEVDDRYLYDDQIATNSSLHSTTQSVAGIFKCYNCKGKKSHPEEPREWASNGICVEIWISPTGHRYRTRLNSQMCNRCHKFVEPYVFKDDYVTKVVRVLDDWTGLCSVVKPLQNYPSTGPHQTDKCYACIKGICHLKPAK